MKKHTQGLYIDMEKVGRLNIVADLGINGHFPEYDVIRRSRGARSGELLGNFGFREQGCDGRKALLIANSCSIKNESLKF